MKTTAALTILLAVLLSVAGPLLDDHNADWQQSDDLQTAIQQAAQQQRFAKAAQAMCGPQAAWQQQADGSVLCSTKYGRPTITVKVSP